MMGRNHVLVNGCAAAALTAVGSYFVLRQQTYGLFGVGRKVFTWFYPSEVGVMQLSPVTEECFVFVVGCLFFFWIGCLLPDIDSEDSRFGRYFRLPMEHRTWTHTIWACLLLFGLSWFHVYLRWLWLGYVLHIFGDFYSAAGVCLTYPKKRYIRYKNGAFVAPGHKAKLYYAGKISEKRFAVICMTVFLFISVLFGFLSGGYWSLLLYLWR